MTRTLAIVVFLALAGTVSAQEAVVPSCELIENESVTLRGQIVNITFAGPPNYESIKNGDAAETVPVLILQQSVCKMYEFHVWHLQMFHLIGDSDEIAAHVGQNVVVTGTHFWAETGHHHTAVMLDVSNIEIEE